MNEASSGDTALPETETALRLPNWGAGAGTVLGRGAVLGRYFILDRLGSGGMGIVYAAYDPELDRKVAVKLLRPGRAGSEARLLREAQAMARLSHPNVLAVHDVGTFGEQVFVAMELVDGADLRQWLAASPRSEREVLDVFLKAGRGLAAAHAAGLVHLDFKPANVLVGRDGRVRVADFGLARLEGSESGMAGTPGYMAPEQLDGRPVDARADQLSFCVSLWEALCGERPSAEPSGGSRVPVRLRRILLRGLAADPADRFASMDDLLLALENDPLPVRRRWAMGLAAAMVAGSALLGLGWVWRERAQICGGAEQRLAGVWDPGRKEAVHKAFLATGAPFAESAFQGVERAIDGYVRGWTAMRTDTCEATRRRGEQSEEVLDLRMACLDRSLESVNALAGLFARADRGVVEKAVEAASGLPSLEDCADVPSLRARVRPPRDPAVRQRIAAAERRLAELNALVDAGRYKEGLPRAAALEAEVRTLKYPPLEAEALYRLGQLQTRAGDSRIAEQTLFNALAASEAGRDGPRAVDVDTELVWVVGDSLGRPEEAQRWASLAQAKLRGMGGNIEKEGWLLNALGSILMDQGRFTESEAVLKTARDRLAAALGPASSATVKVEFNLANILLRTGRSEEAGKRYPGIVEKLARSLGPDHPSVATGWSNLSLVYQGLGRFAEAESACRRALAIRTRALGPEHPETADNLLNLGFLRFQQGRPAEALSIFQRVYAIHEKVLGPDNPHLEYSLMNIAQSLETLHRYEEALPPLDRTLAIRAARPGQPIPLAEARFYKGQILWEMGRRTESLALIRQAREVLVRQGEPAKALLAELDAWRAETGQPGGP